MSKIYLIPLNGTLRAIVFKGEMIEYDAYDDNDTDIEHILHKLENIGALGENTIEELTIFDLVAHFADRT